MLIISLVLSQIVIFVGLIYFFKRILSKNVISATKHLEELSLEYSRKEKEVDRQLEEARHKSEELLSKAREEAEAEKARIIKAAEEEKDRALKSARSESEKIIQQADRSRELLISEIEEKIAKGAVDKACELIQNTVPEKFKQDVHSHWVKELIEDGFNRLESLQVPEDIQEVRVISAFSLSGDEGKNLSKKLKELFGREIRLKEEVDSKIVVGIIVAIGSLVLDGSLRNRIKEQAANID